MAMSAPDNASAHDERSRHVADQPPDHRGRWRAPQAPRAKARNGTPEQGRIGVMTYALVFLAGAFVGSAVSVCAMGMAAMSAAEKTAAPDRADNSAEAVSGASP